MNHGEIVSFIWGVADLIRDTFKRGKYQDVILPLTVLRRLDCVLAPTKEKVLATLAKYKGKGLENVEPLLRKSSGFAFYNTSSRGMRGASGSRTSSSPCTTPAAGRAACSPSRRITSPEPPRAPG